MGFKSERKNVYNYAISDTDADSVEFHSVQAGYGGGSGLAGLSAINLDPQYMANFGYSIRQITKITVPQKTLNTIISTEISHLSHIDILSIDVEGGELKVLKGLDLQKYNPRIILVENVFNSTELVDYILSQGYRLDKHIDYNQYFVKE